MASVIASRNFWMASDWFSVWDRVSSRRKKSFDFFFSFHSNKQSNYQSHIGIESNTAVGIIRQNIMIIFLNMNVYFSSRFSAEVLRIRQKRVSATKNFVFSKQGFPTLKLYAKIYNYFLCIRYLIRYSNFQSSFFQNVNIG